MPASITLKEKIVALLTDKISDDLLTEVKNAFEQDSDSPGNAYTEIKDFSQRLLDQLRSNGGGIVSQEPDTEVCVVYMDKCRVARLMNYIPENGYLMALPAKHTTESGMDSFTISLLGADQNRNVLNAHITGSLNGEETWARSGSFSALDQILP